MRTNVLNDLSNVVKKGAGLACSWSQVGRMSEGAPDEHPMSIRSASDGERWKPAGEKGSTRVWKHVAMIFAVLVMSIANIGMAWGAEYTLINQSTGAINNTDFCVSVSASSTAYTVEETSFSKCISLGGAYTSPVGAYPETKIIRYDVKTNDVTITVYAYNKATSKYSVYVSMLEEGATTAVVRETSWTGKSGKVITERFTPTKNASIYVHVGNNSNLVICQVSASENGSNLPSVASNGYSIRLDSCRATTTAGTTEYLIDGALKIKNANNGARIWNKSYPIKLKSTSDYISFITTSTMSVSIKASGTYSVTKSNTYQSGSAISGNQEVELTSGTWYICPNGSNTSFTTLSFASAAACGETAQAALTLSSNSGTICGTGSTTFTVSGGSGSGALSVSSSDETKATASIDGSTVTVTGVAAGSATITVTKACDATYAEKTATYSATVAAIPTAAAGADKTTEPGEGVALAATAAASGCTGAWTIQSGPNTSTAQLSSTSSATATFTPTVAGTYTLRWTVTNTSSSCSAYDEMTVKAAICSISDCGNATITYPLNVGTSLINTAANLVNTPSNGGSAALTVPAASAAVTLSTITISDKDGKNDNYGKAAATTSACYPTAPTMSSKIGMYNGSSYSSSNYLQFVFTVNSGYTFTPCDIQFTVQPVSHEASFRWEVTDGTNIYGYGVATDIPVGSSGGASVMTGLTSTTEMAAGDYYIRLYPYYNGSNTFRISNNVILKGTTAAAAPSCSDDTGLAYGETTVNKVYGDAVFTNTLTNPNSLGVTYSSTNTSVATVNSSTGAVTIAGAGTTTIKATWVGNASYCEDEVTYTLNVKPNAGSVTGDWDRFGGETIDLSVSPTGGSSYTYQWQKWYNSQWNNVSNGTVDGSMTSGATTNNLQITNCSKENSGSYRCQVTSASQTNETGGYQVKVYVLECYTGGTTVYNFTRDGENQRGSVTIDLAASTGYTFKVHADNDYYGNDGTINSDATNWVLCNNSTSACTTNLTVNSGLGGTFTFTMDYSASGYSSQVGEPELSVTYPRKRIYLDPGVWDADGAKFAYNYWREGVSAQWTDFLTEDDCGMYADIPQWNGVKMIAVRLKSSTVTPGSWDDAWNQTSDLTVTSNDYIVVSNWDNITYNSTYSTPTYTISYNAGTGGSGSKSNETKTCGVAFTLPNSAVFTRTGYTQTGWTTSDGGAQEYALGGTYTTNEDKTFYPVWTVNNYDLTWNLGGGTTTSAGTGIASGVSSNTTSSVAYGTSLTAPTVTKTGYNFSAWSPTVAGTMPAANTTYTATWTVKTTAITLEAGEGGTDGSATATYGTSTITDYVPATRTGYTLGNYYKDDGDHNILTKEGTLNTGNKGSLIVDSKWASEDAAVTLYAQWSATSYTLSYDLAGGSVVSPNPTSYTIESSAITLNNPTKTGYTFAGWTGTGLAEATTTVTIAAGSTGNRSYTATWTAIVPTSVSLNKSSATITEGGTETLTATISPAVVADNTITWSTSDADVATVDGGVVTGVAAGTATITATTVNGKTATCEVTVEAAVTYRVTYDAQGGSVTPAYEDVTTATLPTPTKSGYTFQGWYTSGGTLISGTYNPTVDITLHALWREDECAGGGGGGSTTIISVTIPSKTDNTSGTPASGTIGGTAYWKDLTNNTSPFKLNVDNSSYVALRLASGYYAATDQLVITGANKAHYVYTGTHGNGTPLEKTGDPSDGVITYTLTGIPASTNEIYIYRLGGTGTTYNGTVASMSVTRAGGGGTCYYVTYNGNGADGGFTTDEASHPSGSNVTVASNSFTKTGYRFTGWKTEPSGGTSYAAGGTISGISGNMTLYAQWEEDVCTSVDAPTALTCSAHTSSSLTFTWTKAANASTYTAKLYSDAECTSQVASQALGDVSTVTFSTLSAETTYYCKVQSHGDGSTYCADGGTTAAQSGTTDAACSPHGLAYATASVAKNVGDAAFTNTLTNPNSLSVSYSSSVTSVATVNATSGMVTIVGAGSTVITATWAGNATYCAGTATYTLTVSSGCTPQSLSKVSATSGTSGTVTGYNDEQYAGDAVVNLYSTKEQSASLSGVGTVNGYKMGDAGTSIVFATLKGTSFQVGDKVRIGITRRNDLRQVDSKYNILTIYYGTSKSDAAALTTITTGGDNDNSAEGSEGAGFYEYTLTDGDVTTIGSKKGIGLFRESDNGENPYVYSVEIIGCREWAVCTAPDAVAAGSVTGEGATFTITDALNTNNYEIYYSTSSTAPTAETSAIISGISTKSRAVTGLTAETTYYYWVRSNCGGATKSSWVAGTPASFTTEAAAATHNVTYNGNGSTGGSVPTDATAYEEGDVVTVLGNTGSLVKTGQTFLGWSTNATASSGTFYPAGYKFYMPNAAVTLYAVWGSAGEEKYYYGSITITTGALTPGSTGGHKGFFTNSGGTIATSSAISLSSTPSETGFYYESSTLTHTELSKSSNWNTSSSSKRTIRAFKFANNTSYTLALGSATATKITFYGKCGSASRILSVGGVEWTSNSTKETFEYHEFTKVGNFTGNVTIGSIDASSDNRGDFYGILVVTVSTGAGSNHTVTFNMNGKGSAIEPITDVPSGSKISAPIPSPTAVGAEFGGWYREAGCTNAWNFGSSTISKDTTLYAKWTTCAPSISAHPVAATYTQDAAATALSVTASGEGLNYQWYTSEDGSADIQGSSAIPDATSASYTPSTSLLGTIYYFCVVSNTCGNAVSNKAAITVNDSKPAPTANWTVEEPEEGGKGFTFSIEVNKEDGTNWDGELIASMLTLSDNAILDGSSIVVDNTNKTISGTYGVKAGSSSPVTFYLLLPATATQSATRLDHDRTFIPCAGGAGDSYNVRVRKDYEKDASNNYRWVTPGAGEITYAVNSSISSAKASSAVGEFDSIMSNDKQYVWVKTYEANTKTIRLHVETSGANISVNALYKNTVYATAADKDIVSSDDYSVSYDGSGSAENTGAKGTHYMDITFDSPLAANDIICVKFSSSKVKAYGAVLTTVGDGGDQTTGLTWSNSQASGATVEKQEDAADFTITAVRDATALKSLGLISYTSSNTAIATIDGATGLVHIADNIDFGSDEFKTTTITATLAASGCYKKAVITYILKVTKYVCTDTPGTITYVDRSCSGMDLTLEGYEEGATIKWYKDGVEIPSATSATYNATVAGEYYAVTHKTCDITSTNSITLEAATATAEKIVDSWYVKNGRRTPDIALVQTTGATSFTVTSGGTITEIGGCTFELKDDGIIYLHGQKEDGSAPSDMTAGDMTITITVSGCSGALSGLNITIHKQAETAKPSVAFVVDGTLRKDGGTATSVSADKTSNRPLWTYLSSSYALTGCNVYWSVDSKELREYYSQYDAILITDDPSTYTTGTGGVPYVKAFGTMVDVRPILTMEAYVGRYSDGGWHVYKADPTSPNPRQVEMKLECKNHDIFKGLDPETSDNVRVTRDEYDNEYWHVIMVDTTVAPYHNTSKDYKALPALQGFDPHKFDHMLGVGTIAEETLQGGVERQEEPAARMMILGIQNEAMAALTNEGKLIIKNAIEYLLKTNLEDVNDCSNYFTGGPSGTGDNWATPENWSSGKVPDFESRVRILRPVVISGDTKAIVARVDIATSGKSKWVDGECNGKVTVNSQGALIVGGKIRRAKAPYFGIDNLEPTENDDLIVKAATDTHKQGALIFDNSDGDTHAVVEMWNPSHWDVVDGKKKKYWSYVAVPIQEADIPNFFWYGFTYLYDETSGWIKKSDGTSLYPFQGIGASLQSGNMETFYGPLATTESQDITLTYTADKGQGMNLIGNSWTAPIQIANFEEDDFGDAAAEVWVFNTGHENEGHGDGTTTTAGQWNAIPINSAGVPGYEGLKVIPAMQAFEVNTTTETTLHLDYDRLVRAGRENLNVPMRSPRRSAAKQIEATMRVRVSGELTHTDVYLLKDARFSDAFDNGWDGHYLSGDDRSAQLYAISEAEGELAFLAQPEIEGTQLGFAPSKKDTEYTFSFSYDGEEPLYLNDLKLKESTLIDAENTYLFTYEEGDAVNRFYISATPFEKPNIATGTETIGHPEKVQKVMYKDHIYIIRGGKVFDVVGKMVK